LTLTMGLVLLHRCCLLGTPRRRRRHLIVGSRPPRSIPTSHTSARGAALNFVARNSRWRLGHRGQPARPADHLGPDPTGGAGASTRPGRPRRGRRLWPGRGPCASARTGTDSATHWAPLRAPTPPRPPGPGHKASSSLRRGAPRARSLPRRRVRAPRGAGQRGTGACPRPFAIGVEVPVAVLVITWWARPPAWSTRRARRSGSRSRALLRCPRPRAPRRERGVVDVHPERGMRTEAPSSLPGPGSARIPCTGHRQDQTGRRGHRKPSAGVRRRGRANSGGKKARTVVSETSISMRASGV